MISPTRIQRPMPTQRPGSKSALANVAQNQQLKDAEANQEAQIKRSYSEMRRGFGARQDQARGQLTEDLARQEGLQGGFGGASLKLRQKGLRDLNDSLAQTETGIGAQEAQQFAALESEKSGRAFATSERMGSQDFAAKQNELARQQQQEQFRATLSEQSRQFDTEFNENRKTNAVNAAIALKDAELNSDKQWQKMFSTFWGQTYGFQGAAGPYSYDPFAISGGRVTAAPAPGTTYVEST